MRWPVINSSSANPLPRSSRCCTTPESDRGPRPKGSPRMAGTGTIPSHAKMGGPRCAIGRSGGPAGRWARSATGCGGWRAGPARTTTESLASLERAIELGCNFFDTAWAYGDGAQRAAARPGRARPSRTGRSTSRPRSRRRTAPGPRGAGSPLDDCFPPDHIREYAEKSLENLGLPRIDLLQFHVWEDAWARDDRWQRAMDDLKREGLIRAVGVSVNRWEPWNVAGDPADGPGRRGAGDLQHLRPGPAGRALPALPRAEHRRDRARAVRRGDAHRHADPGDALARGRLAQHLLRPREPRGERRPRRGPPAARARGDDHARAGPALDPGRADGLDDHPRDAQARGTSRRTWPRATAVRSTPACSIG